MKQDLYNLTNPQKSIWYTEEYFKGTAINNICGSLTIHEPVDFDLFRKSINIFIQLNDSFHIKLLVEDSTPKQYFSKPEDIDFELIHINTEDEILNIEKEMVATPFNIINSPLFQFKLFKLPNGHGGFVVNTHHIISDAATLALIGSNIAGIYTNLKNNIELDTKAPSYKDYISSEQEYLLSDKFKKDEQYWNEKFETIPDIASIPASFKDSTNYSSNSKRESFTLPENILTNIKEFCSTQKISLFNFFMAIYSLYIGRVSNLNEFVIGTPILNRTNFNEKHTPGMFISNVPLKISIDDNSTFINFVSNIAKDSLSMLRHQKYPYQYLIENLRKNHTDIPNLYDTAISYQITKTVDKSIDLPYSVHWIEANKISNGFNIHIHDNNDSGNLIISYDYLIDKYSSSDITSIHDRVLHIINQLFENNKILMKDIEIVTPEEKNKILTKFNTNNPLFPKNKNIVDLFKEQAILNPEHIAVKYINQEITYKQLDEASNKIANYLISNKIKPNSIISVCMHKNIEFVISILGILKAGCAYLPINIDYPMDRISYITSNSKSNLIISNIDLLLDNVVNFSDIDLNNYSSTCPKINISPDSLAYVIYTSGSTGNPKGVMVQHKNLVNFLFSFNYSFNNKFNKNDNCLSLTNISFDVSVCELFTPLAFGSCLILYKENILTNIPLLVDTLIKNKITFMYIPPNILEDIYNYILNSNLTIYLNKLLVGVEAIKTSTLNNYFNITNNLEIINGYGPTESTICCTFYKFEHNKCKTSIVPIGNPLTNNTILILNNNLSIQPIGITGNLYISGANVSKGYLNNSDLTNKTFLKINNSLYYNTGDLAYFDSDGIIHFVGRKDNQIKLHGYRIELGEINNTLKSIPEILNSFTTIKNINGSNAICSYVVTKELTILQIKEKLKNLLPYYMMPNYISLIDSMPLTSNGKIDKSKLPDISITQKRGIILPTTETEQKISNILKKILELSEISITDNFFELGADSLSIIKLITEISFNFKIEITFSDILKNNTIKTLCEFIDNSQNSSTLSCIKTITKSDFYPTSRAQKRIYYSSNIAGKNSITYNVPGGIIFNKLPDIAKLEKCFNELITRHEALRTYFDLADGNVVQKIVDKLNFKLNVSSANYKDIDLCFKNFVKPFNLNKAPLFRTELIKFENNKCLLLLDMHHIISDGTSLQIFIKDLCALYNNETLENINLTYKDFSVWENNTLNSNMFDDSKKYWLAQFKDEIPVLNMPTTYPRPAEKSFKGAKVYKTINTEITKKVRNFSKENEITPYMLLLSAYYILLSKYSMQDDIVIGSPIVGRDNAEVSNIIGMFVNTLPLRAKINDDSSFIEFLQNVKNTCLNSFNHQTYPLDELINNLEITRDSSRNPLFDVLFTYQNNGLSSLNLEDIKSEYYIPDSQISKFDLSLEITPVNDILNINFEYCTELFNEDFIQNISEHYINILNIILNNPEIKISEIDMLLEEEKNKIIYGFNNTFLEYPKEKNLVDLFKEIVSKYPNNIAVKQKENEITYKELDEKSNALALQMRNKGIKNGDIVGVCITKSIELIISIWAILKNGCAYMPMYVGYPKDRLEYMIENSNCKLLIVNSTTKDIINTNCNCINILDFNKIENTKQLNIPNTILPTDLAYIIYTSGSTGRPKGVKIMHKNLINYIFSFNKLFENISSEDKFLSSTNISFDVSIWELFLSILNGSTLVLYTEEIISNILEYTRNILDYGITTLYIPPNILDEVYTILQNSKNIKINKILVGVEPIKKKTLNKYYDLNPNLKIVNGYGPTETTICSTALKYKKDEKDNDIVSIGKPLHNTQIYIVDKNMHILPIGVPGELCISGDGVGDGYINNPSENNTHFVKNIFGNTSKLYKTGDIAKWNENGTIKYITRKDNQVKLSGYRIELKEIDYVIMHYPNITKCFTTIYNTGKKAYLTTYFSADTKINLSDLSAYLQTKLAFYMVPTVFMQLNAFPLTVNGKIDKNNLPAPQIKAEQAYVAPSTELEKKLCTIWQDLFGIEKIGINDNFFDLGGDSLSAIKFQVEALNQNLNISYSDIFAFPTIKLLTTKANNELSNTAIEEKYNYTDIDKLLSFNDVKNIPETLEQHKIKNILLTGSTGFLGAHILDEYLSSTNDGIAYCFVRRKNSKNPEERLQKTLQFYFGNKYNNDFGKRIKVITTDITLNNFGLNDFDYENLSTKIDIVINSAALVKHYGNYELFNDINVLGTQKLIDFCKKYNKKLYHISTTSVSGMGLTENNLEKAEHITYFSERDLYKKQSLDNTYIKTKFEAEKLILENINTGLDACIFRMGNISNRFSDAKFQINVSENAFVNRIKSILKLQVLQDGFKAHSTEFAPVDLCAQAIIKIIESNPKFTVFHIFNTNLISFIDLVKYINDLNLKLEFVSDKDFSAKVNQFLMDPNLKNEVAGIIADLDSNKIFSLNANILLNSDFSQLYLEKLGFKWPTINQEYISKYIQYFKKINYFD